MEVGEVEAAQSPGLRRKVQDYSWLQNMANEMVKDGRRFIPTEEIWSRPEVQQRQLSKGELSHMFSSMFNIYTADHRVDGRAVKCYVMPLESRLDSEGT
jgi:hypothetical protein